MTPETETAVTRARLRKAQALARVLESVGALGADVALIDDTGRRAAEVLAGVPLSSDVTWSLAADILTSRRALAARLSDVARDPFGAFDV